MSRILIADGDPHFRTLYHFVFSGHDLYEATSVAQALGYLESCPIDLVVTEWEFADGTAQSLLDYARTRKTLPIVLVSLIQDLVPSVPEVRWRLDKPFRLPDLRRAVGQLLAG